MQYWHSLPYPGVMSSDDLFLSLSCQLFTVSILFPFTPHIQSLTFSIMGFNSSINSLHSIQMEQFVWNGCLPEAIYPYLPGYFIPEYSLPIISYFPRNEHYCLYHQFSLLLSHMNMRSDSNFKQLSRSTNLEKWISGIRALNDDTCIKWWIRASMMMDFEMAKWIREIEM